MEIEQSFRIVLIQYLAYNDCEDRKEESIPVAHIFRLPTLKTFLRKKEIINFLFTYPSSIYVKFENRRCLSHFIAL